MPTVSQFADSRGRLSLRSNLQTQCWDRRSRTAVLWYSSALTVRRTVIHYRLARFATRAVRRKTASRDVVGAVPYKMPIHPIVGAHLCVRPPQAGFREGTEALPYDWEAMLRINKKSFNGSARNAAFERTNKISIPYSSKNVY